MEFILRFAVATLALGLLAGCAVNPMSQDMTGFQSKDIVHVIRCVARDAIRKKFAAVFREFQNDRVFLGKTGPELADWLEDRPARWRQIKFDQFSPYSAPTFKFYENTSISFDLTLDGTESNTAGIDVALLKPVIGGTNSFGVVAKNERTRETKTQSTYYDSFASLMLELTDDYCSGVPETINILYPIAGVQRLDVIIDDFIEESQTDNLGGKTKYQDAEKTATITFTTKFTGNFDPTLTRTSVGGIFVPSSLKLNSDNYRLDTHTLLIFIALPSDRSKLPKYDQYGRLLGVDKSTIDQKFEQIRTRNFQDAVVRRTTSRESTE